jgi:hypothetical protein
MSQTRLHDCDPAARLRALSQRLGSAIGVDADALRAAQSGDFADSIARAQSASAPALTAPANRKARRVAASHWSRDPYLSKLEREGRAHERWRRRAAERTAAFGVPRAGWSRDAWIIGRGAFFDASGATVRAELRRRRRRCPGFVGAVIKAALGIDDHGHCRRDWTHERARGIGALAIAFLLQSKRCRRKDVFQRFMSGITAGSMRALLESPWRNGRRLHKNTLIGRRDRNATIHNGGLGYLQALRATHAIMSQQLPADRVEPFERWRVQRIDRATGEVVTEERASNRYWLATGPTDNGHMTERVAARVRGLAELAQTVIERPIALLPLRRLQPLQLLPIDPAPS